MKKMLVAWCGLLALLLAPPSDAASLFRMRLKGAAVASGSFADVSLRVGRLTRANAGGVPAGAQGLGLLLSGSPASWTFTKTAGGSKWPASVTNGNTPEPSSNLDDSDAGQTITYSVTADGVATGKTLTINIQPLAESAPAYTVSNKDDVDNTSPFNATSIRNNLGGKRVEIQAGSDAAWADTSTYAGGSSAPDVWYARGWCASGCVGTVTITNADPTRKPKIGRMYFQGLANAVIEGLEFAKLLPVWDPVVDCIRDNLTDTCPDTLSTPGQTTQSAIYQADQLFKVSATSTFNVVSNITLQNNTFGAGTVTDASDRYPSGISISGLDASQPATSITIQNNTLTRVKNGIAIGATDGMTIANNTINYFSGDAFAAGGPKVRNLTVEYNLTMRPMPIPSDPGTHQDFAQFGSGPASDYENITVRFNGYLTRDGLDLAQGPFSNDVAYTAASNCSSGELLTGTGSQRACGYFFRNAAWHNNLYEGGFGNGMTFDAGTGWTIYNNTIVLGELGGYSGAVNVPTYRSDVRIGTVSGNTYTATGNFIGNVGGNNNPGGLTIGSGNIAITTGLPTATRDETARIGVYDDYYQDPGNDDPLIGYLPKVGGPLDLGGGKFAGWKNPDGSWADAR